MLAEYPLPFVQKVLSPKVNTPFLLRRVAAAASPKTKSVLLSEGFNIFDYGSHVKRIPVEALQNIQAVNISLTRKHYVKSRQLPLRANLSCKIATKRVPI